MIQIGSVNIDTSHPLAFCDYLHQGSRARYTGLYHGGFRGDDEVLSFLKKFDIKKRYSNIEELADHSDIGLIQSCNWDRHLEQSLPFIRRKKPVFIDKPIVGNEKDCRKLEELSASGAVILGSSSFRYCEEITQFLKKSDQERGQTLHVSGTVGVDEFNYAIHIVEAIQELIGQIAVSCRFLGKALVVNKICETYFIRFANESTATYHICSGTWHPSEIVILTSSHTFQFRINSQKLYPSLLDRICDYMEGKSSSLAPVSHLTDSIRILLAGRISRQKNGREVFLKNIPKNDPGFDGSLFESEYALQNAPNKIYLSP